MSHTFGIRSITFSLFVLCLLTLSTLATGKSLRDQIVFGQQIQVNGTTVKPGTYEIRFDAETSELTIARENKVVVKARVAVQSGQKAERQTTSYLKSTAEGMALARVIFRKDDRVLVLEQ